VFPEISVVVVVVDEHEEIETPKYNQNSNVFTNKQLDLFVNRIQNKQKSIKFKKKKKKHKVRGISVPLIQSDDWKFRSPSPLPLSLARCVFVSVTEKPTETRSIRLRKRKTRSVRFFFFFDDSGNGRRGTHPLVLYFHGTRRFGCRQMLAVGSGASVIMRSSFPKSTAGLGAASGVPIRSFWVI
jgi:hypothetical protein